MVHNLEEYRSNLMLTENYATNPRFLNRIGWEVENSGHVIVEKDTKADGIITVVGRVIDHCLFVGPNGNYSSDEFGDFSTAKFLFHLAKAKDTPFEEDFDKALQNFEKIQAQVAGSANRVNFIVVDGQTRNLHFTRNIFEKWVSLFLFTLNGARTSYDDLLC
jgi:hypothetical protein